MSHLLTTEGLERIIRLAVALGWEARELYADEPALEITWPAPGRPVFRLVSQADWFKGDRPHDRPA